jgi:hypothetical protein
MSEIPFVRTGYAKTLFEKQIPELLEVLGEINGSLKSIAGPNGGGPIIGNLRAAVASLSTTLATAVEPHDDATREAATKAEHALGFALDDARRLTG